MTIPTPPIYTPTIDQVAALIRARTKDRNGNELGTFTDTTRPTDAQAAEHIANAVVDIHTAVGNVGCGRCADLARNVAALGAAAEIEASYFPEQSRTDRSVYTFLRDRYNAALEGLAACVRGDLPDYGSTTGRWGTLGAISATVEAFYTGTAWPRIPPPPEPPHPEPQHRRQ